MFEEKIEKSSASSPETIIHTMKEDLAGNFEEKPKSSEKKDDLEKLVGSEKPKPGPFSKSENQSSRNSFPKENSKNDFSSGKVLLFGISITIILTIGAGAYYFWNTRIKNGEEASPIPNEISLEEEVNLEIKEEAVKVETVSDISQEKLNYLNLDLENLSAFQIKEILREKAEKTIQTNAPSALFEFQITDKLNNPIPFSLFAQKAQINLSQDIIAEIKDSFYIYIFMDENSPRFGLSLSLNDAEKARSLLKNNENSLISSFSTLYLTDNLSPQNSSFSQATYKNYTIEYINLAEPQNISFDYSIHENKLTLGTSKLTLRVILDKISPDNPIYQPN